MNVEALKAILDGIGLTIFCMVLGWEVIVNYPAWYRRDRRAEELLRSVLSSEQYRELTWNGYLDFKSPRDPECIYRAPHGPGLVRVIEKGQHKATLCLLPLERVPDSDMVVMHKLMIESNEELYLQTANRFTPMSSGGWND